MSLEQVEQFIREAQQTMQTGHFAPALELTEQALALDPTSSDAHVLMGVALAQLNRPEEATQAFLAGIRFGPQNTKAFFNLAVHYHQQGQKALSEEMARETLRINSDHPGAKSLLGGNDSANEPDSQMMREVPRTSSETEPGAPNNARSQTTATFRPGYDASTEGSLQFVERMGKGWVFIGMSLALLSLLIGFFAWADFLQVLSQIGVGGDPNAIGAMIESSNTWLSVLSTLISLISLLWMIFDVIHRRGNWLWMLPYVLCCCCSFGGVCQLIYLWQGRK